MGRAQKLKRIRRQLRDKYPHHTDESKRRMYKFKKLKLKHKREQQLDGEGRQ